MMNLLSSRKLNPHNLFAYIVPLTAALIICRAFPVLSFFYYAVPIFLALSLLLYLNRNLNHFLYPKLNLPHPSKWLKIVLILVVLFGVWAAITSFWSPFLKVSLSRSAYFILVSVASVLLGYFWVRSENNELFGYLLPANFIVMIVSFYSLITATPDDAWTGGHGLGFKGFASHQNTLASAIIFTIPSVLFPFLKEIGIWFSHKSEIKRMPSKWFLIFILILILNLYLLIISVSCGSVLALIIMVLSFFLLSLNWKGKIFFLSVIITLTVGLYYSSHSVREFIFKTESRIGDRRVENINETVQAAKNGGLVGLGYGISQQPANEAIIGYYEQDGKIFIREKMISALALIEETGLVGLFLFAAPLFLVIWRSVSSLRLSRYWEKEDRRKYLEDRMNTAFLISVIIAFCFHAQIEAWWVGVGSIELPLFYFLIGGNNGLLDHKKALDKD